MSVSSTYLDRVFSSKAPIQRRNMLPPHVRAGLLSNAATYQDLYLLCDAYYINNGLYDEIRLVNEERGGGKERLWPLRNPVFRIVEFYASKLWPGPLPDALPISTDNQDIIKPIEQVWEWSNWAIKKQLAARYIATYGDLFIKVAQVGGERSNGTDQEERVYFQVIRPYHVTEMDLDERGYVTFIRLDIDKLERNPSDGKMEPYTHTEVWSKEAGTYRMWRHNEGRGKAIKDLGRPDDQAELTEFGIDFVPFVYAAFRDIGEPRGVASFGTEFDKIDELNAMATRLHRLMFRYGRPIWAVLSHMVDATRRGIPAPRIEGSTIDVYQRSPVTPVNNVAELEGETVLYFPGQSEPKLLIPQLQYNHYLEAITAQQRELEDDQPELTYYRVIREFKETSGRALQYMLSPAIDRVLEVRGSVETALARANGMALTMGKPRIWTSATIGAFEASNPKRNFKHKFLTREVIPQSDQDKAETMARRNEGLERASALGIPRRRIEMEMGYNEIERRENEAWRLQEEEERVQREIESTKEKQDAGVVAPPVQPGQASTQPRGVQQQNSRNLPGSPNRSGR